jgi:hypothetical protein
MRGGLGRCLRFWKLVGSVGVEELLLDVAFDTTYSYQ